MPKMSETEREAGEQLSNIPTGHRSPSGATPTVPPITLAEARYMVDQCCESSPTGDDLERAFADLLMKLDVLGRDFVLTAHGFRTRGGG